MGRNCGRKEQVGIEHPDVEMNERTKEPTANPKGGSWKNLLGYVDFFLKENLKRDKKTHQKEMKKEEEGSKIFWWKRGKDEKKFREGETKEGNRREEEKKNPSGVVPFSILLDVRTPLFFSFFVILIFHCLLFILHFTCDSLPLKLCHPHCPLFTLYLAFYLWLSTSEAAFHHLFISLLIHLISDCFNLSLPYPFSTSVFILVVYPTTGYTRY